MSRKIIEDETFEMLDLFLDSNPSFQITDVQFSSLEGVDYVMPCITFTINNVDFHATTYMRIRFDECGNIHREFSGDGTTWMPNTNHAIASKFGAVKPSDDYTATGTAANGLVPSQKALYDATQKVQDISSSVTSGTTNVSVVKKKVTRIGNLVEILCDFTLSADMSITVLQGLPVPAVGTFNVQILGATGSPIAYIDNIGQLYIDSINHSSTQYEVHAIYMASES